jgi:hypothetical protein
VKRGLDRRALRSAAALALALDGPAKPRAGARFSAGLTRAQGRLVDLDRHEVLIEALDLIERHGRLRGGAGDLELGICPGNAIRLAADGDDCAARSACLALQEAIKRTGSPYSGIPEWSDYIASDEDVIAVFRRAIGATAR